MKSLDQRERVIAVADALYAESGGEKIPTVAEVRARAKTDSNVTTQYMREWRAEMERKARSGPGEAIPEGVLRLGEAAMSGLWAESRRLARSEYETEREDWQSERSRDTALLHELSQDIDAKYTELQQAREQIVALEAAVCSREGEIGDLQERLAAALRDQSSTQVRATEAERRAATLEAEAGRLHEALAQERARRAEDVAALSEGQSRVSALLDKLVASAAKSETSAKDSKRRRGASRATVAKNCIQDGADKQLTLVHAKEGVPDV